MCCQVGRPVRSCSCTPCHIVIKCSISSYLKALPFQGKKTFFVCIFKATHSVKIQSQFDFVEIGSLMSNCICGHFHTNATGCVQGLSTHEAQQTCTHIKNAKLVVCLNMYYPIAFVMPWAFCRHLYSSTSLQLAMCRSLMSSVFLLNMLVWLVWLVFMLSVVMVSEMCWHCCWKLFVMLLLHCAICALCSSNSSNQQRMHGIVV